MLFPIVTPSPMMPQRRPIAKTSPDDRSLADTATVSDQTIAYGRPFNQDGAAETELASTRGAEGQDLGI
ncbi:MAG: hypothetical protein U0892_19225 [Pirellulales bacterium]